MKKYCLALDLIDDPKSIQAYEQHHATENMRPAILAHDRACGITSMEIYRTGDRLFMIMETEDDFSFEAKAKKDAENPLLVEWEKLMWTYQKPLLWAKPGQKWVLMHKIFDAND
ncbi:L-rhamnose mutarotase [Algoriphagus namhaensis]